MTAIMNVKCDKEVVHTHTHTHTHITREVSWSLADNILASIIMH